jgi:hypothetical protein
MDSLFTVSNITFVIGISGIVFGIFHYFKNPQIRSERNDALLEQQMNFDRASAEKKFAELSIDIKEAFALASNHTHTVDTKVDKLIDSVNFMGVRIAELSTIINERIPAHNK